MTNPATSKTRIRPRVRPSVTSQERVPSDRYEEYEAPEEEYEEYYDEPEERGGLMSSPGRAAALIGSVLLLLVVFGSIAFIMGQRGKASSGSSGNTAGLNTAPRVGSIAPDFALTDVKTNKLVSLSSLRGKPVWINFWGTWCPPCRAEMPEMQKIYNRVQGKVTVLGVSMGPRDNPANVVQFVDQNKYTWQFIHDADQNAMYNYQVTGIPSSFFIDKDGVIRNIHVGGADGPTLEAALATIYQ